MTIDFKVRGKCKGCRKQRWFIRKRKVHTPVGEAKSQDLICNSCYAKVLAKLDNSHGQN